MQRSLEVEVKVKVMQVEVEVGSIFGRLRVRTRQRGSTDGIVINIG